MSPVNESAKLRSEFCVASLSDTLPFGSGQCCHLELRCLPLPLHFCFMPPKTLSSFVPVSGVTKFDQGLGHFPATLRNGQPGVNREKYSLFLSIFTQGDVE
jgi:hypothetical protein